MSRLNINRYFYVETIFLLERQGFVFSWQNKKEKNRGGTISRNGTRSYPREEPKRAGKEKKKAR